MLPPGLEDFAAAALAGCGGRSTTRRRRWQRNRARDRCRRDLRRSGEEFGEFVEWSFEVMAGWKEFAVPPEVWSEEFGELVEGPFEILPDCEMFVGPDREKDSFGPGEVGVIVEGSFVIKSDCKVPVVPVGDRDNFGPVVVPEVWNEEFGEFVEGPFVMSDCKVYVVPDGEKDNFGPVKMLEAWNEESGAEEDMLIVAALRPLLDGSAGNILDLLYDFLVIAIDQGVAISRRAVSAFGSMLAFEALEDWKSLGLIGFEGCLLWARGLDGELLVPGVPMAPPATHAAISLYKENFVRQRMGSIQSAQMKLVAIRGEVAQFADRLHACSRWSWSWKRACRRHACSGRGGSRQARPRCRMAAVKAIRRIGRMCCCPED